MWPLCIPDDNVVWTAKCSIQFLLFLDTTCPRSDHWYHIPCSISFTTSSVFLLAWYYIPVTESHVATFIDVISPSRPYVSLPVMWVNKSRSCSHMSSTVPSEYPTYTFMDTVLPDDGWCSLSSLGKQWVIWAHGLRRRSLGIAVATMNYMTWSCCNPSRNVQSHHSPMIWSVVSQHKCPWSWNLDHPHDQRTSMNRGY